MKRVTTQILNNIYWLFADKAIRIIVNIMVSAYVARYLGPSQFGELNYIVSLLAIFVTLTTLSLNGVVVRELVSKKFSENQILSTTAALQFASSIITMGSVLFCAKYFNKITDKNSIIYYMLALSTIIKSTEIVKYWLDAEVNSKIFAWSETVAAISSSTLKIYFVYAGAELYLFAFCILIESIVSMVFIFYYSGIRHISNYKFRWNTLLAKYLLIETTPVLLTAIFVSVHMMFDRILLEHYCGPSEVGLYSAASYFITIWYFIPTVLIGSFAARLSDLYIKDMELYLDLTKSIFRFAGIALLIVAITTSFSSEIIISLIFGSNYEGASKLLSIGIYSIIFVFQVSFRGRLLIIEGKQITATMLASLGMLLSIIMNVLLIPRYGAIGASYAFVSSWGIAAIALPLINSNTKKFFLLNFGIK